MITKKGRIISDLSIPIAQAIASSNAHEFSIAGIAFRVDELARVCFVESVSMGWYHDIDVPGELHELPPQEMNFGERISLMHSELSEALEGHRKNLQSDKIPGFTSVEEELADLIIRVGCEAGAMNLRLGDAVVAKLAYNRDREDHKIENRRKIDGKRF